MASLAPGRGSFTYDDNGNMLSASGTPALSFVYNPLNQLTSYTSAGSTMTFGYDVLGNRASKTAGGSTTKYIGGLVETDSGGAITAYYVYGLGLISTIRGSTPYYYQYDGLGSTVAITNSSGTIVNSYAYDDYGQVATNAVEGISNAYKYVGRYGVQTDAADLLYMRARYYMPSVGRFINKDPIGLAGGMNLYGYAGGNPINEIDPSGLFVFGRRPLSGWPWVSGGSRNPIDDFTNTELSHEHGFFEDGSGDNIGFGRNGRFSEPSSAGYVFDTVHYNDDIMREALKNVRDGIYSNLPWNKNNCQDWAQRLREEYERLKNCK